MGALTPGLPHWKPEAPQCIPRHCGAAPYPHQNGPAITKPPPPLPRRHTPLAQTIPAAAARLTDVPARAVKATFNSAV